MPENKNQHYVPRCHLRPFSLGADGDAINLYNFSRDRLIECAPVKGQCSRDFFYGKNLLLEQALQRPEGIYSSIVAKAANDPSSVTSEDLGQLRDFTLLQTFRTFGYVEKLMAMAAQHNNDLVSASPQGTKLPPRALANVDEAVMMAISQFSEAKKKKYLDDLDTCLVINNTKRQFVTSDDPAVQTNRFHFQKLNDSSFGLGSAGAMFLLPLSPMLYFMAFDANVYAVSNRKGNTVAISRDDEVATFNELQILHARQNLYYAAAHTGAAIQAEFRLHSVRRPSVWHELSYFKKSDESSIGEMYEHVDEMTLGPGREFLVALKAVRVRPSRWIKLLNYRLRPRFVKTGTGLGYVRPYHPMLDSRI